MAIHAEQRQRSESPISIRDILAQGHPTQSGFAIQAARDVARAQVFSAEARIEAELPVKISESRGRLSYTPDTKQLGAVARLGIDAALLLNGNPFSHADAIGHPEFKDENATAGFEAARRTGEHLRQTRDVTLQMRDAMRAVYKPDSKPWVPGFWTFVGSIPPGLSHVFDLAAFKDMPSYFGQLNRIPVIRRAPFTSRLIPRPNTAKNNLITVITDYISFGVAPAVKGTVQGARLVTHHFAPLPGSVLMNRHGNWVDNRVIEQYLPQSARRELTSADATTLTERQERFFKSANDILRHNMGEVFKTQEAVRALLKKAGVTGTAANADFAKSWGGKVSVTTGDKARTELTQAEVSQILAAYNNHNAASTEPRLTAQEVSNLMSGLDMLDVLKKASSLAPAVEAHRRSQHYKLQK